MTTVILILALIALATLLVSYARHDHFAGPANSTACIDDLGPVDSRRHLVPRP